MTDPQSYREILEFLNTNQRDLLLISEKISSNTKNIPEEILSSEISSHLEEVNKSITKILWSWENLTSFWTNMNSFTGGLQIQKVIKKLKGLKSVMHSIITNLGVSILKLEKSRPYLRTLLIHSIDEQSWYELSSMLKTDENFIIAAQAFRNFKKKQDKLRSTYELQEIFMEHPNMSESDKEEYTLEYIKTKIPINEFLKNRESDTIHSTSKKPITPDTSDTKEDFDGYKTYLEADERELARMKRTGKYSTRKRGKKRRRSNS